MHESLSIGIGRFGRSCLAIAAAVLLLVIVSPAPAPGQMFSSGTGLDPQRIKAAIEKGVGAIYKEPPPYAGIPAHLIYNHAYNNQQYLNATGNHAVSLWAMLSVGESYQNPEIYRRLNWVLSRDSNYAYDRGMRAQMLAELPRERWRPWIHRDGVMLTQAITNAGNFNQTYTGGAATGPGDNATGSYAVLGLQGLQRAGFSGLTRAQWLRIDEYWRKAQQKTPGEEPAGWGIFSFSDEHAKLLAKGQRLRAGQVRGPMTAAGVSVLCYTERYLNGQNLVRVTDEPVSRELRKGLLWLDTKFSIDDKAEELDRYYYFFSMQNVGRATGYRTFNGVDWFRDVTEKLLAEQSRTGAWKGPYGDLIASGFALLYLGRADDPLAISKIRWYTSEPVKTKDKDGKETVEQVQRFARWNNRPHDVWNFVDYASDQYEVSTTWQIAELDEPASSLIESPILYLSTDEAFSFTDKQLNNLRRYIQAGGLLVTNADEGNSDAVKSINELAEKLFAAQGFKMQRMPMDHPIMNIHQNIRMPMQYVHNGVRPLMIHMTQDLSKGLQRNDYGEDFEVLSNIYLYVTGMNPRRARLANHHIVQRQQATGPTVKVARIRHSGNYDPEPLALEQIQAILANDHNVNMQIEVVDPADLTSEHKVAFLTALGGAQLTNAQAKAIREWVEAGGTLVLDPASGDQASLKSVQQMRSDIAPTSRSIRLAKASPIISGKGLNHGYDAQRVRYRFYALKSMGPNTSPALEVIEFGQRPAIIYSGVDLTAGMAGLEHWGIYGYSPDSARMLVLNTILYAMNQ